MDHNRAASYIRVFPGDTLTAAYQAESIRRLADALGMTIVREYEDEEYDRGPRGRPQFQRMMEEARPEPQTLRRRHHVRTSGGSPRARQT